MTKSSKILQYVNYRMRATLEDGRQLVGKFMAFDKHMNIVLGDCEEFRRLPQKGKTGEEREEKRSLGLVVVRGESLVSLTVESKPPPEDKKNKLAAGAAGGPGTATAAGRGLPVAPMGQAPAGICGCKIEKLSDQTFKISHCIDNKCILISAPPSELNRTKIAYREVIN